MRTGILIISFLLASAGANAQDFASIFMDQYQQDSIFTLGTIGPTMMENILSSDIERNEDIEEIIAGLKSMRIVFTEENSKEYFAFALDLYEENTDRYELFGEYSNEEENYRILTRKKDEEIVEMIMLVSNKRGFAIIDFTGTIKPQFISALANALP